MAISEGRWKLFRHLALFNRLALALAACAILNLIIEIPPQHGKSQFWSKYFPAWFLGQFPQLRVVLASYEASFAASWGRQTRDILEQHGPALFGVTVRQDTRAVDDWELQDAKTGEHLPGGMVTAGVGGPLTGRAADLAIVDDPIKNAEEASSKAHLDKLYDWWTTTVCTRVHEGGRRVVLMTRWAEDDLVGRILKNAEATGEKWVVIRLPALAEEDEDFSQIKGDDGTPLGLPWTRKAGEVLCRELYSQKTMEERRDNTLPFWWATMYQQRPYPREGGEIKSSWFKIVRDFPKADYDCRAIDLAASENKNNKQTALVRMIRVGPKEARQYFIVDIRADWWASGTRDQEIQQTAETDGKGVTVVIEQEPGSGGKTQAEAIARMLDGWSVEIVVAGSEGSKVLRADPLASAAHVGKIFIVEAPWNARFLEQVRSFPGGKLIDMVDAAAMGFNWLASQPDAPEVPAGFDPMEPSRHRGDLFPGPGGSIFG